MKYLSMAVLLLVLAIVGGVAYGIYEMSHGSTTAAYVLGFLSATAVMILFYGVIQGIDMVTQGFRDRAENQRQAANMRENAELLNAQFKAQQTAIRAQQMQMKFLTPGQPQGDVAVTGGGLFGTEDDEAEEGNYTGFFASDEPQYPTHPAPKIVSINK